MKHPFKVGDVVWCVSNGEGVVECVDEYDNGDMEWPVRVRFKNSWSEQYTLDGRMFNHTNRILFFSEPVVTGMTERPFKTTLIGKVVHLESKSCNWQAYRKVTAEDENTITYMSDGVNYYEEWKADKDKYIITLVDNDI